MGGVVVGKPAPVVADIPTAAAVVLSVAGPVRYLTHKLAVWGPGSIDRKPPSRCFPDL